jgi:hypothetical protein
MLFRLNDRRSLIVDSRRSVFLLHRQGRMPARNTTDLLRVRLLVPTVPLRTRLCIVQLTLTLRVLLVVMLLAGMILDAHGK